jgi:hypothetical protein
MKNKTSHDLLINYQIVGHEVCDDHMHEVIFAKLIFTLNDDN